jgi:Xaa-Pro aminopeptidase
VDNVSAPAVIGSPVEASQSFSPEVFRERRERLLRRIGDGIAVLPAAPELFRSRDTEVPYRQDSDFYYLTGFGEPEAVAVLTPHDPEHRFTLFVRPRDPEREAWNGPRAGVEGAREGFGADAAYPIEALEEQLYKLALPASRIFYALGRDPEMDERVIALLVRTRRARPRSGRGPTAVEDLEPTLGEMRRIKGPAEVERMRVAAAVAVEGHRAIMAAARPGMGEWELEAVLEAKFRSLGATGPAFPSIVGSGANATVLHYVANQRRAREGELVLVDAGAEVGMYCSDITRTFPVSGRFSAPQRALYETVLAAEEAAIEAVRPGAPFADVHDAAVRVLVEGLVRLEILDGDVEELIQEGAYKRYYMHQTSHWLGLDVHDVGLYREHGASVLLEAGMVLTVEPGLYIPPDAEEVPQKYRGIGIRIEDDVLVTAEGHEVLTRGVPVAPDLVEALVGSGTVA